MGDEEATFKFVIDADGSARIVNFEPEQDYPRQHRPIGGNKKRRYSFGGDRNPPATIEDLIRRPRPICSEQDQKKLPTLKVIEKTGDLFTNAQNTVLVHACNCQGKWGAGIAAAFKEKFPKAFEAYAQHCKAAKYPEQLSGTALLIAPDEESVYTDENGNLISPPWIGCLFTSTSHGQNKDGEFAILCNTINSMKDLLRRILRKDYYKDPATLPKPGQPYVGNSQNHHPKLRSMDILAIRMCQINAGLFDVPWYKTKGVLERIEVGTGEFMEVEVVVPPEGGKRKRQPKAAGPAKSPKPKAPKPKTPKPNNPKPNNPKPKTPKPKATPGSPKRKKKDQAAD